MLTLRRPGTAGAIMAQPVRGPVQAPPTVRWELDGAVAVIRNSAFDSRTGGQLRDAVDAAATRAAAPLAGLVLDLRGNAGGLLDAAEQVAGLALPEGSVIGSLRGRARTTFARCAPAILSCRVACQWWCLSIAAPPPAPKSWQPPCKTTAAPC
ncbi:S41 family peptidase [Achromobacter xylosoxidans]